ncbi:MAG: serine protease [Aphanizomenon flos-aquae KM1D3_PB]|nr:tetratricopeptide repeat-containing serine protease family protein [Aphanizomenon gracile PMC644.10]QSV69472.1 MAG: serine protease [Aphanizomenon flos-aquae KM1D3_PB]
MKLKIAITSSLLLLFSSALTLENSISSVPTIRQKSCEITPENNETGEYSEKQQKTITNQITVKVIGDNNGGSGAIIGQNGNSYLFVTNSHVLGGVNDNTITVKTYNGKIYPAKILPNSKFDKIDLAVLQFISDQTYCLPLGIDNGKINVDTPVLAAGYPSEKKKIELNIGRVKYISQPSLEQGYQIGYTSYIEQGMSGGPIINSQGYLIGINGRTSYPLSNLGYVYSDGKKATETEIKKFREFSWGIPMTTILGQIKPEIITAYSLPQPNILTKVPKSQLIGWLKKVENQFKQFIVRIDGSSKGVGSGVIIAKEENKQGNIYTVLTAADVVRGKIENKSGDFNYQILTVDDKVHTVDKSSIKLGTGVDLAVVKFSSQENYQVATLANYPTKNGEYVFTAGYSKRQKSPWLFTLGQIFSREEKKLATIQSDFKGVVSSIGGYELVYSNITSGGMSGSPVLDSQGRVIGIHQSSEGGIANDQKTGDFEVIQLGNSFGIPISKFLAIALQLNTKGQKVETKRSPELKPQQVDFIKTAMLSVDISQGNTTPAQWLERGNQLSRLSRYGEAINAFDNAIKQKPDFIHLVYYGKGLALFWDGKYQEAVVEFEQAVKYKTNFSPAWNSLSTVYRVLNQLDKSLNSIDKAIEIEPNNPNLYNQKFLVLNDLKKYEEAEQAINKAIILTPRSVFYYHRGLIYSYQNKFSLAVNDYNEAIKIDSHNANAYNNRGLILFNLKNRQGAINDLLQAAKLYQQQSKQEDYQYVLKVLNKYLQKPSTSLL